MSQVIGMLEGTTLYWVALYYWLTLPVWVDRSARRVLLERPGLRVQDEPT